MKPRVLAELSWFGLTTVALHRRDPIIGSIIVTDRCNLACKHCAVANIRRISYPLAHLRAEMESLHAQGVRILFLYGGEPFLWRDGDLRLRDVVVQAREVGFDLVNVVTNGTYGLDLPGADLIMVSVDGTKAHHDFIRGRTYDTIIANIEAAPEDNLCLYMAVNNVNADDIEHVARLARDLAKVRAASYNFHTPYPGTEWLTLTREQRRACAARIGELIAAGYPVLNMASALPAIAENTFPTPCHQCVIVEDGQQWTCGRCIETPGLCEQCGYFFAAEFALLFSGRPRIAADALKTYVKYL